MDYRVFSDKRFKIKYIPELSLAMYRELAVHLSQVDGFTTELIPQDSSQFDYAQSQIAGMWVNCPTQASEHLSQLVQSILNHYGSWQIQT